MSSTATPVTPAPPELVPGAVPPHAEPESVKPPHAPRTGRWKRLLGPFYFTGVFWYRFHLFGVTVLPDFLIGPVIRLFTVVFYLSLGRVRRAVGNNLEAVLGPCGFLERQRRVWRTLHTFAWCLSERYEQFVEGREFEECVVGNPRWEEFLHGDEGLVFVTAHIGNWELASSFSVGLSGRVCHIVRERELDAEAQDFVESLVSKLGDGCYRTHFAEEDPLLGIQLMEALREGEMVALQCDRPRTGGRTIDVKVCGLDLAMPVGTAALAHSADVIMLPVFFFRVGRRKYRSVVRPEIRVDRSLPRKQAIEDAIRTLGRDIEWAIRESPHEWFCFRDLTR